MSYRNHSRITVPAAEAFDSYLFVVLLNGELALCDPGEKPLGVLEAPVREAGDLASVRLLNCEGTIEVQATGAVAAGGQVVIAAGGKVVADSGAGARTVIGMSLTAVTDGGVIEVVPYGYGHDLS